MLQTRKRDDPGPARMGFTVSKKVGTAVERNRVRRRLKDAVNRFAMDRMIPGHDYVLVGRRNALTVTFARLGEELERAFELLGEKKSAPARSAHGRTNQRAGDEADDKRV